MAGKKPQNRKASERPWGSDQREAALHKAAYGMSGNDVELFLECLGAAGGDDAYARVLARCKFGEQAVAELLAENPAYFGRVAEFLEGLQRARRGEFADPVGFVLLTNYQKVVAHLSKLPTFKAFIEVCHRLNEPELSSLDEVKLLEICSKLGMAFAPAGKAQSAQ
jgi:hypothetical protein